MLRNTYFCSCQTYCKGRRREVSRATFFRHRPCYRQSNSGLSPEFQQFLTSSTSPTPSNSPSDLTVSSAPGPTHIGGSTLKRTMDDNEDGGLRAKRRRGSEIEEIVEMPQDEVLNLLFPILAFYILRFIRSHLDRTSLKTSNLHRPKIPHNTTRILRPRLQAHAQVKTTQQPLKMTA